MLTPTDGLDEIEHLGRLLDLHLGGLGEEVQINHQEVVAEVIRQIDEGGHPPRIANGSRPKDRVSAQDQATAAVSGDAPVLTRDLFEILSDPFRRGVFLVFLAVDNLLHGPDVRLRLGCPGCKPV